MDVTPEPTNLLSQLKKLLRGLQHNVAQIQGEAALGTGPEEQAALREHAPR